MDIATNCVKLCITCKHIGTNSSRDWETFRCFAPQNYQGINLVDGSKIMTYPTCKYARQIPVLTLVVGSSMSESCGPEGNWWEEKQELPKNLYGTVSAPQSQPTATSKPIKIRRNLADELGM